MQKSAVSSVFPHLRQNRVHCGNNGGECHAVNEVQSGEQATKDVLQAGPNDNCIEDCRNKSDDQDFLDQTKEVSVIPADTSQEGSELVLHTSAALPQASPASMIVWINMMVWIKKITIDKFQNSSKLWTIWQGSYCI